MALLIYLYRSTPYQTCRGTGTRNRRYNKEQLDVHRICHHLRYFSRGLRWISGISTQLLILDTIFLLFPMKISLIYAPHIHSFSLNSWIDWVCFVVSGILSTNRRTETGALISSREYFPMPPTRAATMTITFSLWYSPHIGIHILF